MASPPDVSKCASPHCKARFRKLGDGKLWAFRVDHPERWGVNPGVKQKVVWLCSKCAEHFYIRVNRRQHRVEVVRHPQAA